MPLTVAAVAVPSVARADGDPASDVLLAQPVFFPNTTQVPQARQQQLTQLVRDAARRGFRVRVAIIAGQADLGAVTVLWRKPQPYARFLGQELRLFRYPRVLIVMPNGYGLDEPGPGGAADRRLIRSLPRPGNDLVAAAETAVQKLAARNGVQVTPRRVDSGGRSLTRERIEIVLIAGLVLLVLVLVRLGRRLWHA